MGDGDESRHWAKVFNDKQCCCEEMYEQILIVLMKLLNKRISSIELT